MWVAELGQSGHAAVACMGHQCTGDMTLATGLSPLSQTTQASASLIFLHSANAGSQEASGARKLHQACLG